MDNKKGLFSANVTYRLRLRICGPRFILFAWIFALLDFAALNSSDIGLLRYPSTTALHN